MTSPALNLLTRTSLRDITSGDSPEHRRIADEVIKRLERIVTWSGHRADFVFHSWLDLLEASLTSQQALAEAINQIAADYDTTARDCLSQFLAAQAMLRDSVKWGYYDTLGLIYMRFANPNPAAGQYFTPFDLSYFLGRLIVSGGEEEVLSRLEEAAEKAAQQDPAVSALIQAGGWTALLSQLLQSPDIEAWRRDFFWQKLLPAILSSGYYQPLTICDPAVGSGSLLLGAAAQFPDWMIQCGMVVFVGMDIDPECVKMSRISICLYGLNGSYWKHKFAPDALKANDDELKMLGPAGDFYRQAREAHQKGDHQLVQQYIEESRRARAQMVAQQMALFQATGKAETTLSQIPLQERIGDLAEGENGHQTSPSVVESESAKEMTGVP